MPKSLLLLVALAATTPSFASGLADADPVVVPRIDPVAIAKEDAAREAAGLPPRYAVPFTTAANPGNSGLWSSSAPGEVTWTLDVEAPGAVSVNLGFTTFDLPNGATLHVFPTNPGGLAGTTQAVRPFTAADNAASGELWTPVLLTSRVTVEVTLPVTQVRDLGLELGQVGSGYRGFGAILKNLAGGQKSGSCNIDVVCPEGAGWQNEIGAVGVISTGGSTFCTGFMVNNTAQDKTPYFMTANHCGISASNAASLVVYWNYETSTCGASPDGQLTDFQTGSSFRSGYSSSDFTLVELGSQPNPAWQVTYAGWDHSGAEATTAIAIHHPNTDEKRISFEFDPTTTTDYLGTSVPGNGTHVRVTDWDKGTTEPGSSGSPLFDQNHRIIGQLHGGYAACGNDLSDWYGRFSASWAGGGTPASRLSDWLDPLGTGALTVDSLGIGLSVSPGGIVHNGQITGPFNDPVTVYTLSNASSSPVSYKVSLQGTSGLVAINGGLTPLTGNLAPGANVTVTATLTPFVTQLGSGVHSEAILFEDVTHATTTPAVHDFLVGEQVAFDFPFDTDPGWQTQGAWAFGVPLGGGGVSNGSPDPTAGATGANVYGYNLAGDYTDNLPERLLISAPLDLSNLTGTRVSFQRWLNVETSTYDHARFWVSTDGITRTTVWENGSAQTDSSWNKMEFDIASLVDGQSTVYLGWSMGKTDGSVVYSGWNVDDVRIVGMGAMTPYGAGCPGTGGIVPSLAGSGNATPGGLVTIDADGGLAGGIGLLFLSLAPDKVQLFGCDVLIGGFTGAPFLMPFDAAGHASLPAVLPTSLPPGAAFFMQLASIDSGAPNGQWALSNGLELLVQ
jgi:hypothetical protein